MSDDRWAAAKLLVYATVLAVMGLFLTGQTVGLLVGAPLALAGILRAFGFRDLGDFN